LPAASVVLLFRAIVEATLEFPREIALAFAPVPRLMLPVVPVSSESALTVGAVNEVLERAVAVRVPVLGLYVSFVEETKAVVRFPEVALTNEG
jgi:hypothetical protein